MARSVKEWIGKTPDSRVPDRVQLRVFERHGGKCHYSGRKIMPGEPWEVDHIVALVNWTGEGHGNRESNLAPILKDKHRQKTRIDVAMKAKAAQVKKKHYGLGKPKRDPSPYKRKMDGTVVYRDTGEPVR